MAWTHQKNVWAHFGRNYVHFKRLINSVYSQFWTYGHNDFGFLVKMEISFRFSSQLESRGRKLVPKP